MNEETKDLKPKSFRLTEETAEKFRQISSDLSMSQEETLSKLMENYDLTRDKNTLPNQHKAIADFEMHCNTLEQMYIMALKANETIETNIEFKYISQIQSMNEDIEKLKKELKEFNDAKLHLKNAKTEIERLNVELDNRRVEYEEESRSREDMIMHYKELGAEFKQKYESAKSASDENTKLKEQLDETKHENEQLKVQLDILQTKHNSEIELIYQQESVKREQAVMNAEKIAMEQMDILKQEQTREIRHYQQAYQDILGKLYEIQISNKLGIQSNVPTDADVSDTDNTNGTINV